MPHTILSFSDAHVKRRPDEPYALKQITDIAIANKVEAVIGAGDLIDRQTNRAEPISVFMREIDRLEKAKIPFWYTQGQHDWDNPPWLSAHRWAKHLHKQTVELGPFVVYGLDWLPYGELQNELAKIPEECNLLVAHQVWGDWMGDVAAPQGSFAQIPGQIATLITGDLHKNIVERHKNAGGETLLTISTGATTQQKIDEPSEHFCCLLGTDSKGKIRPDMRKLRSRPFYEEMLNTAQELDNFVAHVPQLLAELVAANDDLPDNVRNPTICIRYGHKIPDAVGRIEKAVGDRAFLNFKPIMPEEKLAQARERKLAVRGAAVTPLAMLPRRVNKDKQPLTYACAERLLRAQESGQDVDDELRRWWTEQLDAAE